MDRNREAKKMNGIKRRYRNGSLSLRESPVHDDAVDMHENSRFRDRKKERDSDRERDRERNRLSQSKRYKRRDDDESSEESVDDEEEDDEIETGELRSTPFVRDSSVKHVRSLPPWVGDEVGGISVPRKARTASGKRSHDCWISGGEASTSPSRRSNKKMLLQKNTIKSKSSSKISKAPSSIQEIEFEVAEVLYGMTRRASNTPTPKPEGEDSKPTASSSISAQSVSQTSSALEQSSSLKSSPASSVAPKRKKSRLVKSEDGSPLTLSTSYASKMVPKIETRVGLKTESSSPKVDKFEETNLETSGINAPISDLGQTPMEMEKYSVLELELPVQDSELEKGVERQSETETTKVNVSLPSESSKALVDADQTDISAMKCLNPTEDSESLATSKIDLMAPHVKSSPDSTLETVSNFTDHVQNKLQPPESEKKTGSNEEPRHEDDKQEVEHFNLEEGKTGNGANELEPHADKESQDKDDSKCSKQKLNKPIKHETKTEKFECSSLSMPMTINNWPGSGLPPIGFIGQVPSLQAVIPMGPNVGSSPIVETRIFHLNQQPKRCAMHCYIAKSIQSDERAKTNPFWPGSVSAASICGAVNTYNLNAIPIAECATVCNPVQGTVGGKNSGSSQEKASSGNSLKDKGPSAVGSEASQRKQIVLHHVPQANNTQQQLTTTARPMIPAKSTSSNSNVVPSSGASNYIAGGSISTGSVNTGSIVTSGVGFTYPTVPPNEGQYLTIVQNNGYPIQVPAHVRMPPYVSGHAQPAFFGGSFYPSQVLHPSQIQQSQSQAPTSQSSGSAQKNQQHLLQSGFSNNSGAVSHNHLNLKHRQQPNPSMNPPQSGEESPSTTDTRVSHSQKNIYSQNFPLPVPQNFVLVSSSLPSGANHNEKQQKVSKGGVELVPAQAYAMSFASLNGAPPPASTLDFSSVAPNHVVFHAISDHVRPGYQIAVASSNASTSQSKLQQQGIEEAKTVNEPIKANQISAEGKKVLPEGPIAIEHNIVFSKTDGGHVSSIDGSARSLNSVQSSLNNNRTRSVPTVSSTTNIARMNMAKLPASHSVFQQSLLEGSNGGHTQWRTSARTIPTTVGSSTALPGKNMPTQVKNQHNLSTSGHTQISFSTSPKVTSMTQVHGGSPSPRSSTSKTSSVNTLPLQSNKNSPSNSNTKLSSINSNPSILGNPPVPSVSGAKTTAQHNLQQKQQFQQTQFFFNAYPIVQSTQPSSVSISHQRRQLDQSTTNSSTSSNGVFSLCPPSFSTSDPAKVLPAQVSAMKGMLPSPSILHATHSAHSIRPSLTYMHTVQTKPNKPTSDSKPATGV